MSRELENMAESETALKQVPLEISLGEELKSRGMTVTTAESCTGGLVGHLLTNVAGSSQYYWGGVISYDNQVKQNVLQVPAAVLETVGAVSPECAVAMAHGVRRLLGSHLAVSTTGIAGPGGATPGKPVGLVYVALVDGQGYERCERYIWEGDRIANKELSAQAVLQLLGEYLTGR